ncbi:S9 family peptidase [Puia sp.]|jgi:dipeptidyl aminopeptidase/acylaminoacyl peptidase|uniref:S9 family peptidase n=1 Tax=Puia sp. TaxID=2045100 RepID=UPI002F40CF3B
MLRSLLFATGILSVGMTLNAQTPAKRPIRPADMYRLPTVSDPQLSPDGKWVSYSRSSIDSVKDSRNADIWMVSWDGSQDIQLTSSQDGESRARWSPDGKWLSFLSARATASPEVKGAQVWLMDRRGGEGKRLTELKGGVSDYAWSPDSKKLLLTLTDPDPEDSSKIKTTKPYVIDRYQYKQDVEGYRYKKTHSHLYLFDIATKKIDTLTRGNLDEGSAVWSPDGSAIAFVSNRTADPDKNENSDIYIIEARAGATMRQLTDWKGSDNGPRWSPDGKWISYTRSVSEEDYHMYDEPVLCVVAAAGGAPRLLSQALDRPVMSPRWAKDGAAIAALVADDREQYVATFSVADGKMTKICGGQRAFNFLEAAADGSWLTMMSDPHTPGEVYALEAGSPRRLTRQTEAFLAPLALATVEGFQSKSADGTMVSGILYRPAGVATGTKLPLVLFIHGGPVGQDAFDFDLSRQMLAGGGFAVAAVNYRGSNGRGLAYSKAISADWGNKEVIDLHGAVDYLVKQGIADADHLGVAGWSYGGILTDYLIASDTRFKAASSGAGTGFTLSLYGVDQYINQYNNEIGAPWKAIDRYLKISYPLLKADRIKTPTLFMSGEKDFNVPTAGSEQMYQALRTLGVPTELIVYPGQFHGITTPSYQRDRFDRWLAWFKKYLTP